MDYAKVKRVSKLADPLKRRGRKAGRAKGCSFVKRLVDLPNPLAPRRANGSPAAPRREVVNSASTGCSRAFRVSVWG